MGLHNSLERDDPEMLTALRSFASGCMCREKVTIRFKRPIA